MIQKNRINICFVRIDNRKYEKIIEKIKRIVRKILVIVNVEKIEKGYILLVPNYIKPNVWIRYLVKRKIKKIKNRLYVDEFAIDKDLLEYNECFKDAHVLNGKYLMKKSIINIMKFIFSNSPKMSLESIYVFINNYSKENIFLIEKLAQNFKTVNILTHNLKYFRRLEEKLYNKGVLITVSNNKRKGAKMARFIVNVDFSKVEFEKYCINMNAYIINLSNEKDFFGTKFNGIIINNLDIKIDQNNKCFINEFYGKFSGKIFLESELIFYSKIYEDIDELYKQYNAEITDIIGVRGIIQKCEFLV